ncbi:hypothetical protein Acor_81270 [Acrocarpospora corrugata]|uniref:Uncharacterized protein n=1 Tax=Acrocarpospora corrugata TaxID=35763 RepID=A0A5M3WI77_9ACTN|nr:hypothetical protein Acor_81270 [Acrocarpospora corrugata]
MVADEQGLFEEFVEVDRPAEVLPAAHERDGVADQDDYAAVEAGGEPGGGEQGERVVEEGAAALGAADGECGAVFEQAGQGRGAAVAAEFGEEAVAERGGVGEGGEPVGFVVFADVLEAVRGWAVEDAGVAAFGVEWLVDVDELAGGAEQVAGPAGAGAGEAGDQNGHAAILGRRPWS